MHKLVCTLGLSLAVITACGPGTGQTDGTTTGETGSTTGSTGDGTAETPTTTQVSASTGQTGTGSTTAVESTGTSDATGPSDTTGPIDGTTSTGDTEEPPETTGGEICGVVPEALVAWNLVVPPALGGLDIDANCEVVGATKVGPETTLELSCLIADEMTPVAVVYSVAPEIEDAWSAGLEVHLAYRSEQPFWINEWLAITQEDTLHLGAIRASALVPADTTPMEFFKRSIGLEMECVALPDRCGLREPIGLGFTVALDDGDFGSLTVKSGEHTSFGNAGFTTEEFFVEQASRLLDPITCDDAPSTWIDAMLLRGDKS